MSDVYVKQGDTLPRPRATLLDAAGAALDLTGAAVRFVMRGIDDGAATVDAVATVQDPATAGVVEYEWQPEDTDTPGGYFAEWQVEFADGETLTVPNAEAILVGVEPNVLNLPRITPWELANIREKIGSGTPPTDADLAKSLGRLGTWQKVALEVLRTRRATLLAQPLKFSLGGDYSHDAVENVRLLDAEISRLDPAAAAQAEDAEITVTTIERVDSAWGR